jgi:2-polyprenyl-3-methyl-5-hydroxy-6-metoxy-1,4-benzoquinol methylase
MSEAVWENRYQTGDMPWEKGAPSPGLVDFLAAHPELPRGTVCVPGCGTGHDARAWEGAGFRAYGYDLAPSAVQLSIERTKAAGLRAQFRLADFLPSRYSSEFHVRVNTSVLKPAISTSLSFRDVVLHQS